MGNREPPPPPFIHRDRCSGRTRITFNLESFMAENTKMTSWWEWVISILLTTGSIPAWILGMTLGWGGMYSNSELMRIAGTLIVLSSPIMLLVGLPWLISLLIK